MDIFKKIMQALLFERIDRPLQRGCFFCQFEISFEIKAFELLVFAGSKLYLLDEDIADLLPVLSYKGTGS